MATTAHDFYNLDPVSLNYVAALRGLCPRKPGCSFTYAFLNPPDPDCLIGMAAGNPEGRFFGILSDKGRIAAANEQAQWRQTGNITFLTGTSAPLTLPESLPPLDYCVWDERREALDSAAREPLFTCAEKALKPGGLLVGLYSACHDTGETLRFLIREFEPEMNKNEALELLDDLRSLGDHFFAENPAFLEELERTRAGHDSEAFFKFCRDSGAAKSGTFDVMAGLLPRHFAFAGDAAISANYMDLSVPESAHAILESCRDHLLYEPIKDFAMNRHTRHDIWCRLPAEQSTNPADLFGFFTFGILQAREEIPETVHVSGKPFDLRPPLMKNMIDLMTSLPMSIGDFLQHPLGAGVKPGEAIGAIQLLVAIGIARPMREHHQSQGSIELARLKWATPYNRYLNETPITTPRVLLASEVVGGTINVPARDALVIQALNRVGLAHTPGAVLMELQRLANDPAVAATIMDLAEPTEALAEEMTEDVIRRSMIQWYAYGLLAA